MPEPLTVWRNGGFSAKLNVSNSIPPNLTTWLNGVNAFALAFFCKFTNAFLLYANRKQYV